MRPILFEVPFLGWPIYAYPFFAMVGFLVAILLAARHSARAGFDANHALDLGLLAVVAGLLGGRVFFYIQFHDRFAGEPWYAVFEIWRGGMVYYGGFIAATVVLFIAARRQGLPVLRYFDTFAPMVPIGVSFGRIGCFLNGCCWGDPTPLGFPLAVQFPRQPVPGRDDIASPAWLDHVDHAGLSPTSELSLPVHPTQLYEWAALLAIAGLLILFSARATRRRDGQVVALLLVLYGVARFAIELLRGDHRTGTSLPALVLLPFLSADAIARVEEATRLTASQNVSVLLLLCGAVLFVVAPRRGSPAIGTADQSASPTPVSPSTPGEKNRAGRY